MKRQSDDIPSMDLLVRLLPTFVRLFPKGSHIIVATSGGPDSQALLDLLARARASLDVRLTAVGIDHGLRPLAGFELDHAEALCQSHVVPFVRRQVMVAKEGNVLSNARRARYAALRQCMQDLSANRLAVAHHANDQAETILLHLTRGCALRGAAGMPEKRGRLARPLLGVDKADLVSYVEGRRIAYALDPSNDHLERARGRLRANILPLLSTLNQGAVTNLARFAKRARADETYLCEQANVLAQVSVGPFGSLKCAPLQPAPLPLVSRVLERWLAKQGASPSATLVSRAVNLLSKNAKLTSGGCTIEASHGFLWGQPLKDYEHVFRVPGDLSLPELRMTLTGRILSWSKTQRPETQRDRVVFDADCLKKPIYIRSMRTGDRLQPFGGKGSSKVGDLFTNHKIPKPLRSGWPLLVFGDEIAWVVGMRRAALAPITSSTRRVLEIAFVGTLPWP